ncbi:hypothetical protein ACEOMX_002473 [Salmonella enterica]
MEQDQLQRLAEEVSAAYLRYLKHKTGDDKVTYDGVTKRVVFEELAFALVGVSHYNAKNSPEHPILSDPHKHLMEMINILTKPYTITDFGVRVVEHLNEISIHKERGVMM